MQRTIIAAVSENGIIGEGDSLPWSIPAEYHHFINTIAGHPLIMGRRSWEIFADDLTATHPIVLTRSGRHIPGTLIADSLDQALLLAERHQQEIFIGGGATIYQQTLDQGLVDRMLLTTIHQTVNGDTRFPDYPQHHWRCTHTEPHDGWTLRHLQHQP